MKKSLVFILSVLLVAFNACSSDDDDSYSMNDIIGKWECYKQAYILKNTKTGDILSERGTLINRFGNDSTWVEAYYENGTWREMFNPNKIMYFEVKGQLLISKSIYDPDNIYEGEKRIIDVLSRETMILRKDSEWFDYNYECNVKASYIYTYRRIE